MTKENLDLKTYFIPSLIAFSFLARLATVYFYRDMDLYSDYAYRLVFLYALGLEFGLWLLDWTSDCAYGLQVCPAVLVVPKRFAQVRRDLQLRKELRVL